AARGCGRGRCRGGRGGGRRRASRLRAADRRQGEQDDRRPGTQADSKTASSMLHIASIPPIEGALPLVTGWSQVPARLPLTFVCGFGRHTTPVETAHPKP